MTRPTHEWKSKRIKAFRTTFDLTQAQAAELVGISQSQWAHWESGRRRPSLQAAKLLDLLEAKLRSDRKKTR